MGAGMFGALRLAPAPVILPVVEEKVQASVRECLKMHPGIVGLGSAVEETSVLESSVPQNDLTL